MYGTYDVSEKIGVSPWYWWADVPVQVRRNLYITAGAVSDRPAVKYRGFFINDEDPAFSGWAKEKFGGLNSRMYEHVFELLLRLKGNYLWPAMWGKAFNDDDRQNMVLADAMGVIMGTSHHEPMTRAQAEWHRNKSAGVTGGAWDYMANGANLRKFWRGGIERMMSKGQGRAYESLVTVGMRGDGDEPMAQGTAIKLLESIVHDQRGIIAEVTGRPAEQTPQVWALYKEVQDYFDQGMKVPDDVLLLFADDNWGQIRRLPAADKRRPGGYGVYYHFDYVGGPRNYKWLNTNQIEKTWQQMDLAYRSGADDLWIVNVGDIKPMEFPLTFFMDMAWNPERMTPGAVSQYAANWADKTFGKKNAARISALLTTYAKLAARRKPELVEPGSFALGDTPNGPDGDEFKALLEEWRSLRAAAETSRGRISPEQQSAYFQLVEHPILAMSNLYELHYAVARNRQLAKAGDPLANSFADAAEAAFRRDREIARAYHRVNGGKWSHMMSQSHIGYTSWQSPPADIMPEIMRVDGAAARSVKPAAKPDAGRYISIEATDFTRTVDGAGLAWRAIPNLGRTRGAVIALPQGKPPTAITDNVRVEYAVTLKEASDASLLLYLVPSLNVQGKKGGLRLGVSIDDGPVNEVRFDLIPDRPDWGNAVRNNAHVIRLPMGRLSPGNRTIKIWRLDDNVVLQKLVLDLGGLKPSYLGPPPSPVRNRRAVAVD